MSVKVMVYVLGELSAEQKDVIEAATTVFSEVAKMVVWKAATSVGAEVFVSAVKSAV